MLIAINASSSRGFGSSLVGQTFAQYTQSYSGPHRFISYVPDSWGMADKGKEHARIVVNRNSSMRKILVDNWHIRSGLVRSRVDALLSLTDTSLPWPGIPHVLFVQQAFLAHEMSQFNFPISRAFRLKIAVMANYFRLGIRSVDRFVVQTRHMKNALCCRWGISEERIEVIPTSIQLPEVRSARNDRSRAEICVIGSAAQHKNLSILPSIIELISRRIPDVRCSITLDEVDVPEVATDARMRGVEEHFRFLGKSTRDDALQLMASARVSLIPSKLESFGLPYWEGLALGVPMVVSDLVFGREICGVAAEYADPDEPEEWAEKIIRLIEDDSAMQALSSRAKKRFTETAISPEEMVGRFIGVVEEVAG